MHVFRDDLGNIKGTKMVHGVQRVYKGIGKAINMTCVVIAMYNIDRSESS